MLCLMFIPLNIMYFIFRLILKETVYQANQHESLADVFAKEIYNSIKKKVKYFFKFKTQI